MNVARLMENLRYVSIDRTAAIKHWAEMVRFQNTRWNEGNEQFITKMKATAGILGHRQTRGFRILCAKERLLQRRIRDELLPFEKAGD